MHKVGFGAALIGVVVFLGACAFQGAGKDCSVCGRTLQAEQHRACAMYRASSGS